MARITTAQAAERLGVSVRRVQALIKAARLPADKLGRDWLIEEKHLKLVAERKPGRPKGGHQAAP
jgi:excisionase family DNA binding protein